MMIPYFKITPTQGGTTIEYILDSNLKESGEHIFHTHLHESNHAEQGWRPYFGWQSE